MARVTVEDCIDKVESPYELVLVAKERTTQLNSGMEPTLDRDNDKNTVISLREIAVENVKVKDLIESGVYKLRKHIEQVDDGEDLDEVVGDDFENLYKGEVSKSGTPILPSKRARKVPEKIQVTKEDLSELNQSPEISDQNIPENSDEDVSLDTIKEQETENLPKEEKKNILVICPGFASDCVETLEEILIQGKESFINSGGKNFDLIPCLNDNEDHINLLKNLINKYIINK